MRSSTAADISEFVKREYKEGFVTDIESDTFPPGLNEDVVVALSVKKEEPEFMRGWRLKAYARWKKMSEPVWAHVNYTPIDYQSISYYSAPKTDKDGPKSLDEVDPKLLDCLLYTSPSPRDS